LPNTAQTEEWNGATGTFWAAHDERYDATLQPLTERLFAATPIAATDHVLDVGCGCGNTTRIAAKRANEATTLGVDLSEPMLAQARLRSDQQGLTNVWYERADVQTHDLGASRFDMVISQLGVMFFDDPTQAFTNLRRALRPGGRISFTCWQELARNDHRVVPTKAIAAHVDLPASSSPCATGAFSLADPDRVRTVLTDAGFHEITIGAFSAPLLAGTDAAEATEFFLRSPSISSLIKHAEPAAVAAARDELIRTLSAYETPEGVLLDSASWLVSAS
jgi:ubiquinone/menaquinone biosynthesis C-methylase UbiE